MSPDGLPERLRALDVSIGDRRLGRYMPIPPGRFMPARDTRAWKCPASRCRTTGQMLVLDRFDMVTHADRQTERLGFEDIAALAGLRVRDILSDRKYQGSYQRVAELLRQLQLHSDNLHRFFEQLAFSVMVSDALTYLIEQTGGSQPRFAIGRFEANAVHAYSLVATGPILKLH